MNLRLRSSRFTTQKTICKTKRSKLPKLAPETTRRWLPNSDDLTSSPHLLIRARTTTLMRDISKWQQGDQTRSKSLNLLWAASWGPRSSSSIEFKIRPGDSSKRLQELKRENLKARLKLATISILDKDSVQTKVNCLRVSNPPSSLLSASQVI